MARKNNRQLSFRDSKNSRSRKSLKHPKHIRDIYFQRILSFSREIKENKPKSNVRSKEDQIQEEAYQEAMKNLNNGKVLLTDLKASFYRTLSNKNRERNGESNGNL